MRISPWVWFIGFFVVLFGGKFAYNTFFGPSDSQLIHTALDEAVQAGREGKPGGVLEYLSDSFRLNGTSFGGAEIADFIRNQKPEVSVDFQEPSVAGEYAKMAAPVHVKIGVLGFATDFSLKQVNLVFHQETSHDMLMLPIKRWRLQQVSVPEGSIPSELTQFLSERKQ